MIFDRDEISHVGPRQGFAIINGCQGVFVDDIHWTFAEAEKAFADYDTNDQPDWQIVRVRIEVMPDDGLIDGREYWDNDPAHQATK